MLKEKQEKVEKEVLSYADQKARQNFIPAKFCPAE